MSRRVLTFFIALAIALVGYQPSFGMTLGPSAASMEMAAADGDCPEKMKDDCCDQTEKNKRLCAWNDSCAVRCHVNAGLEAVTFAYTPQASRYRAVLVAEPPPLHPARAGPLFRPPII